MKSQLSVLIVHTDPLLRGRLQACLAGARGVALAGEAGDEAEGLALADQWRPEVVLLEFALWAAGERRLFNEAYPHSRVLILSDAGQEGLVLAALRAGAAGQIPAQDVTSQTLLDAIRTVARGEAVLTPITAGLILDEISNHPPEEAGRED